MSFSDNIHLSFADIGDEKVYVTTFDGRMNSQNDGFITTLGSNLHYILDKKYPGCVLYVEQKLIATTDIKVHRLLSKLELSNWDHSFKNLECVIDDLREYGKSPKIVGKIDISCSDHEVFGDFRGSSQPGTLTSYEHDFVYNVKNCNQR